MQVKKNNNKNIFFYLWKNKYSTVGRAGDGRREVSKEVVREAEVVAAREAGGGGVREEAGGRG